MACPPGLAPIGAVPEARLSVGPPINIMLSPNVVSLARLVRKTDICLMDSSFPNVRVIFIDVVQSPNIKLIIVATTVSVCLYTKANLGYLHAGGLQSVPVRRFIRDEPKKWRHHHKNEVRLRQRLRSFKSSKDWADDIEKIDGHLRRQFSSVLVRVEQTKRRSVALRSHCRPCYVA